MELQLGDYAVWQREFLGSAAAREQLNYWTCQLQGLATPQLAMDFPRPARKSYRGEIVSRPLAATLVDQIQKLADEHDTTPYVIYCAAAKTLFAKYTGETDICLSSLATGRSRAEVEHLVGVCLNTVLLRTSLAGDPTFGETIDRVRRTVSAAATNDTLPFEHIVRALGHQPAAAPDSLFHCGFTQKRQFVGPHSVGGLRITGFPPRSPGALYDLHLFTEERDGQWHAACEFSIDRFAPESGQRFLGHFVHLLEVVTTAPARPLSQIVLANATELRVQSQGAEKPPIIRCIDECFEACAQRAPTATAIRAGAASISYQALNTHANTVANQLIEHGVTTGSPVAIVATRSVEVIAAMLGILKAGGAYVPVDPEFPSARIRALLSQCDPAVVFVDRQTRAEVSGWGLRDNALVLDVESAGSGYAPTKPERQHSAFDLAYVMYTSGSSGPPRGVMVTHGGVTRLVCGADYVDLGPEETILQAAPLAFDASTFEIWGSLLNGGVLALLPPGHCAVEILGTAIAQYGVTTLWLTAGLFQLMIDEAPKSLRPLRQLLAGGDVLSPEHVRRAHELLPNCRLINGYGPTENTTFTCCHTVRARIWHAAPSRSANRFVAPASPSSMTTSARCPWVCRGNC